MANPGDSSSSSSEKPSTAEQQLRRERPQNIAYAAGDDAPVQETENIVAPPRAQQTGGDGGRNVRALQGGDGVNVVGGLSLEGSHRKRRSRNEEQGASSSGPQKPKRKVELLDPPSCDPNCVVCGKRFNSWKALFGHMRSHPERQWRGVFPPPTGSWEPLGSLDREAEAGTGIGPRAQEEIASTLLNVAQGVLSGMTPAVGAGSAEGSKGDQPAPSAAKASTSSPTRGLGIDLNQPQEESPKPLKFDLNMPAPEKDEDNDSS